MNRHRSHHGEIERVRIVPAEAVARLRAAAAHRDAVRRRAGLPAGRLVERGNRNVGPGGVGRRTRIAVDLRPQHARVDRVRPIVAGAVEIAIAAVRRAQDGERHAVAVRRRRRQRPIVHERAGDASMLPPRQLVRSVHGQHVPHVEPRGPVQIGLAQRHSPLAIDHERLVGRGVHREIVVAVPEPRIGRHVERLRPGV